MNTAVLYKGMSLYGLVCSVKSGYKIAKSWYEAPIQLVIQSSRGTYQSYPERQIRFSTTRREIYRTWY